MTPTSIPSSGALAGSLIVALGLFGSLTWAQQPSPSAASPRAPSAAAVEPGVDTSAARNVTVPASAAPRTAPAAEPSAPGAEPSRAAATATPAAGAKRGGRAMDRVNLDASQITGNRELPRVLYIVPWRAPAAGELEGRPVNSLLYELTQPVDREVFRRENRYFDALQATAGATREASPAAGGPEK